MEPETPPKDTRLIREITLRNILSFGPEWMTLPLSPLNVLIGPNGSGKSNLIDTIELMRATPGDMLAALRGIGGSADLVWKGSRFNRTYPPTISLEVNLLNWLPPIPVVHTFAFLADGRLPFTTEVERILRVYNDTKQEHMILFEYAKGKSLIGRRKNRMSRSIEMVEMDSFDEFSVLGHVKDFSQYREITSLGIAYRKIRVYRNWPFGRDTILRTPQRADMPNDYLAEDLSNIGLFLSKLRQTPGAKKRILEELRNLYDGIDDYDVKIDGGTVQVYFTEGNYTIPATRLSDGTLRYLCLLAILCDPEPPPLICIEEPELGLHMDVLPGLARLLVEASTRTQLIVTTHSDILVDALSDTPESIVVCEKHNGITEMERLEPDEIAPFLEKFRLGELWISGQLGGKRW